MRKLSIVLFFITLLLLQACISVEKKEIEVNTNIVGQGISSNNQLKRFFLNRNKRINTNFLDEVINNYINECELELINHDLAFTQMCLETNFLRYTGVVKESQNNYAGIGAINAQNPGHIFPNIKTGIRAHIQHLKAYGSIEEPKTDIVDPRYYFVKLKW